MSKNEKRRIDKLDVLIFIIVAAASFFVIEILLNTWLPLEFKRKLYMNTRDVFIHHRHNIQFDKEFGYVFCPNTIYRLTNREYGHDISINSEGLRDQELMYSPDILFFGDSFAFGTGVSIKNNCEHILGKLLNKKILNFGVEGYGTLQEYLSFKRWIMNHSSNRGKITIFMYYPNDLSDNINTTNIQYRPFISFQEIESPRIVYPTNNAFIKWIKMRENVAYPWFCQFSYISYSIMELWRKFFQEKQFSRAIDNYQYFNAFNFLVNKIAMLANEEKINLLFVYIPMIQDYENNRRDTQQEITKIREIMKVNGVNFLNLYNFLNKEDYYELDGHWRPSGHYKAAVAIKTFMESKGIK